MYETKTFVSLLLRRINRCWNPEGHQCQIFIAWCSFFFERSCWLIGAQQPWHYIGGGLVVVCMTSFASMFGVTSYVRLLNCYMGLQHAHKTGLKCLDVASFYHTGKYNILTYWQFVLPSFKARGGRFAIAMRHIEPRSLSRYRESSDHSENVSAWA